MESWFDFLFHSSVGFSLFFILYWLLLRQSTHFRANRVYLLVSVLLALLASAFPFHYTVTLQSATHLPTLTGVLNRTGITDSSNLDSNGTMWQMILLFVYLTGAMLFALRLLIQTWKPFQIIYTSKAVKQGGYFIHENDNYALHFSFFNHILINPKYLKQEEYNEILTHEQVHIRERHWVDLLIIELLTVIFWFNPFIWLFELAIKQNHEYLADHGVISRGHSPVRYQALLVNQLLGMQVIGLTNNLNFALGPTRLNMMKRQKTSKRKLFHMVWGIPVLAFMLVAFAQPEYQNAAPTQDNIQSTAEETTLVVPTKRILGTVVNEKGESMTGATVLIRHTTKGTVVDKSGKFSLEIPKDGCELVVSFVGYGTVVKKITSNEDNINLKMKEDFVAISTELSPAKKEMPAPPPTPATSKQTDNKAKKDGPVFLIVEDMPQYPGGQPALAKYIDNKKKEIIQEATSVGKTLKGKAYVNFIVQTDGSVGQVKITKASGSKYLDEKAIEIVKGMEKWTPGTQRGKAVPVNFVVPIEF